MPAAPLMNLPDSVSFETAAASTMRGLTAVYWMMKTDPRLKAGGTVLLHAAAGVGLLAVQVAKLLGIRVIGTVSVRRRRTGPLDGLRRNHLLPSRGRARESGS